jgi:hypothetical protein
VPPVWPSSAATAEVEVVPVALTQTEGTQVVLGPRATGGVSGVVVVAWDAAEVTGTARSAVEDDEAHDEEATKGQAVRPPVAAHRSGDRGAARPPRAAVRPPAATGLSGGGTVRPPAATGPRGAGSVNGAGMGAAL